MVTPRQEIRYSLDGYLKELLDIFKLAVNEKNTSAVIIVDGRSGLGKSTISNQIGLYCDPKYTLQNIYYEPEAFLEGLSEAKEGSFLLFDEAMLISSRSALSHINRMVIQAMSMIRSKKIFVCFAINSVFDLDRNLAISRADVLIHVFGDHLFDRGKFVCFFKAKDRRDRLKELYLFGKKYYNYNKPKGNFYGKFPKEFVVDEKEYERRKQIGVNNFLRGLASPTTKNYDVTKRLVAHMRFELNMTTQEIANIALLTQKTIQNYVRKSKLELATSTFG